KGRKYYSAHRLELISGWPIGALTGVKECTDSARIRTLPIFAKRRTKSVYLNRGKLGQVRRMKVSHMSRSRALRVFGVFSITTEYLDLNQRNLWRLSLS